MPDSLLTQCDEAGRATVLYEPYVSDGTAGIKATHLPTGTVEYLYFNPSNTDTGEDVPNVFVYHGATGDPSRDGAAHHYLVLEELF